MVYLRQLILPSERAEIEAIKNEGRNGGPAPLLTAIICNLIANNGLSRLKISHTYDTMILEKCLCKQFAKLEFDAIASKCRVA